MKFLQQKKKKEKVFFSQFESLPKENSFMRWEKNHKKEKVVKCDKKDVVRSHFGVKGIISRQKIRVLYVNIVWIRKHWKRLTPVICAKIKTKSKRMRKNCFLFKRKIFFSFPIS